MCLPNRVKSVKVEAEMARPAGDDDPLLWALGGGHQDDGGEYQKKMPHLFLYFLFGHGLYTNLTLLLTDKEVQCTHKKLTSLKHGKPKRDKLVYLIKND